MNRLGDDPSKFKVSVKLMLAGDTGMYLVALRHDKSFSNFQQYSYGNTVEVWTAVLCLTATPSASGSIFLRDCHNRLNTQYAFSSSLHT